MSPAAKGTSLHSDPLLRVARRIEGRLPWRVRKLVRQARKPQERRSSLVSVVVAASASDSRWLGECLDSLRAQIHRNLEILVVLYGESGGSASVAAQHAAEDWRVRVETEATATEGTARNHGAVRALGRYLCFVAAKDVVPPTGVRLLVKAMDRTGSDVVIGRAIELPAARSVEAMRDPAHDEYREQMTLRDFPLAVADLGLGNRLFRTGFWRSAGLSFPERAAPGQRPLTMDAFIAADTFDLLPDVTYHEMTRSGGVPFGAVQDAMAELDAWLVDQEATWASLSGAAAASVRDAWAYVVCDDWVQPFVDDVERADEAQWRTLRGFVGSVLEQIDPQMWARVRAEAKVKLRLLADDRRPELEEFLSRRWFEVGNRPTEVTDGRVRALLPFHDDPAVPASDFEMSEDETALDAVLRGIRWAGTRLELDIFAWIAFVEMSEEAPGIEVAAVCASTGRRVPLEVGQRRDPEVTVVAGHRYQDYSQGAFTVRLDASALAADAPARPEDAGRQLALPDSLAEWWFEITMVAAGVRRRGSISRRDERGSAGMLFAPALGGRHHDGLRLQVVPDPQRGVRLASLPPMSSRLIEVSVRGRRLRGTLESDQTGLATLVATRADGVEARARVRPADSGGLRFTIELPDPPAPEGVSPRVWRLRLLDRSREEHPLAFGALGFDGLWLGEGDDSDVVVGRTGSGASEIVEADRTVTLESFEVDDDHWRVTARWPGRAPEGFTARIRGRRGIVPGEPPVRDGRRFHVTLPTRWDEWGLGETPLPTGVHYLDVVHGDGNDPVSARIVLDHAVAQGLLREELHAQFRGRKLCHGKDVGVRMSPRLELDERGPYAQKRLQEWYVAADLPLDEKAVYLQSYTGAATTDSQRAIHEELRRSRPDLTVYWAVADSATLLPEGAVPLQMNSREWYRVLATAKYLCNNIDFDRWFVKRPGQQFLETFHGYPAKSMGIRLWEAKLFTPRRLALELARTSRNWDLILTPAPEMDRYYRQEYAYEGAIESAGYPRDDVLLADTADAVRRAARDRLGISPEATVVLYAPTWRDDQATSYRSATMVRHLDLESATERLGSDFVFLMRGHRFHAKANRRSARTARLIDVTDYPEINDLILASDAAVLDYSSLRFDFALTGRPMLFLVPDLSSYTGGVRGFLYPFEESAPGPLIDDAEEVVDRLLDLDGVRAEFADAYEQFNARFNYLQDGRAAERVVKRFFS